MINTNNCPEYIVWGITKQDNGIGGFIETPQELFRIKGYLDLLIGDLKTTNNAFMQESTHVLIANYTTGIRTKDNWITDEDNNRYDITLVDDPLQLHRHLEIYLKFTGDKNV